MHEPSPGKRGARRSAAPAAAHPRVTVRLDLGPTARIGPGKIRLLEAVATEGSISAAARRLGMSYRQAWKLLAQLNDMFRTPLLEGSAGGARGGGTELTPLGTDVLRRYRRVEEQTRLATASQLRALADMLRGDRAML